MFKSSMDRVKNLLIYGNDCFQMICFLGLDTIHALSLHYLIGTHKGHDMLPDAQLIITKSVKKGCIRAQLNVFSVH